MVWFILYKDVFVAMETVRYWYLAKGFSELNAFLNIASV